MIGHKNHRLLKQGDGYGQVESFVFRGRQFYVKRDDKLDPWLSGNKYWKLYSLMQLPAQCYTRLISYGGTQSNAMLALAALCAKKSWEFHYTSKTVARHLKQHLTGNLKDALNFGMKLHEVAPQDYESNVQKLRNLQNPKHLLIAQGGADPIAQAGVNQLADEIKQWQQQNKLRQLNIVLPSGTGTTAYYLAKALPDLTIYTTAVVGDKAYLLCQIDQLGSRVKNLNILVPDKKYHFAKPYSELMVMYKELLHAGIEFDLIYGALMWQTLLQHADKLSGTVLYVHSGGLKGNITMFDRYKNKGFR
ncbi:MAG: 1-aminocyclopropane-1-carboxylate deaminase [Mariprofundaceae bacterium]